jgi:hypothetical protein
MSAQPIDSDLILTSDQSQINNILNTFGVAAYKLTDINLQKKIEAIDKTKFFNTANCVLKEEYNVTEPTLEEKLNPNTYKPKKVPDAASGMIHQYFTPIHHLIHDSEDFNSCMTNIYNEEVKYLPNRLRITNKMKYDSNSLHIEGLDIFNLENDNITINPGEIAMIVGLSGTRKFVFWDIKDRDKQPLYNYYKDKGKKEFTKIDPVWMEEFYPNCRREVNIDCNQSPVLIMWRETTPHEIASSPALSLFISPTTTFNYTKPKINTLLPIEYDNLCIHESNLIGMCYNQAGIKWPSGKKTYMFCHQRSISFWLGKIKDFYKMENKLRCRLINNGHINQHSVEYQNKLLEKNIVLPDRLFNPDMPKICLDLTELSNDILIRYGFISN